MSIKPDDIIAALKKLGRAVSPGELADHLEVPGSALAYHLKPMLDAGTLVATGATSGRRIGLPGQKADDSNARPTSAKKSRKKKAAKKKAKSTPRAAKKDGPNDGFIPAIDAFNRMVIVQEGELMIFKPEDTAAIAALLQTYKA